MTKPIGNLLSDLRDGTDIEHRLVEKHPLLVPLLAPTLSLEQYSQAIAAFTGFFATLEPRMQEISADIEFPDYRYQPRLPLLLEDRAALPGCAVTPCTLTPEYSSVDEFIGTLYVLEGATQGGRVIAPLLQHRLALHESAGARYFNFYRQRSWEKFQIMLEHCQQRYDYRLAVTAARATFINLRSHLDRCLSKKGA